MMIVMFYDVSYFPYLPINYFVLMECLTSYAKRISPCQFPLRFGWPCGLTAPTVWVFGGHFVVSAPRITVQIPLQLWQIPAFCREKSRSHGETTEIGTLAFCSGSTGRPEKHENFYDFARMYSTCSSNCRKNDRPLWKQLRYGVAFCYFLYIWLKTPQEKYQKEHLSKSHSEYLCCVF